MALLTDTMRVLNVGGGMNRELPTEYAGWHQDVLDVDPVVAPDVLCDAREMRQLPAASYDAIFCAHTLEHFHQHEVSRVLEGFLHVLKPESFAQIIVPDMQALFDAITKDHRDIHDVWYTSPSGPITFHDVIYGWSKQIAAGNLYYCHKTGFTAKSLAAVVTQVGFRQVIMAGDTVGNLYAFAFKVKPNRSQLQRIGLEPVRC